jgi:hypothetical protein
LFSAFLTAQAHGQTPAAARLDPLDPKALVPASRYESSFAQFRRVGDESAVSWRDANDAVARIGGWRAYAREAQQREPAAPVRPVVPSEQAPNAAPAEMSRPKPAEPPGHRQP